MKKTFVVVLFFIAAVAMISGCGEEKPEKTGFALSNIDSTVSPGEDFYLYAIGNWKKNNPIPDDQVRWGTFTVMGEQNNDILKELLGEISEKAKNAEEGSPTQKVGDFYATGMDTVKIEEQGIDPLNDEISRIDNMASKDDFYKVFAHLHLYSSSPIFNFGSTQDAKNSEMVIAGLGQGGTGLPEKGYYTNDDERSVEIREKYVEHIGNMFKLMGYEEAEAEKAAEKVMELETRLAEASRTRVELRDAEKNYNKMSKEELKKLAPEFNWDSFFTEVGMSDPGDIDVGQPEFFEEVSAMVNEVPMEDWKHYFKWNLIRNTANYLSQDFVNERFEFYGKFLNGQQEMRPRWKRVLSTTNSALGEELGKLYVEKVFPPRAKKKAVEIVEALKVSMKESLLELEWMGDSTKQRALKKLEGFNVKIGYPDEWRDYSGLDVKTDSFVENVMRSTYFETKRDYDKIGEPVDRDEWFMYPQQVNAYYHPVLNEIVFPAAILQFPFFDVDVDDAINYGGMGVVIGHEITHGFDDQGRKYDYDGNLRDWWTPDDNEKFNARAKMIVEQFDEFEPLEGLNVNGSLTQGENIADLGGLKVSWEAFKKTEQYKNGEKIDGFTPAQRFFLSYAQIWRYNYRDERMEMLVKTDPHAPPHYRVIGPLSNFPPFYEAFDINEGDAMWKPKEERVVIW